MILIPMVVAMAIMKSLELLGPKGRATLGGITMLLVLAAGILGGR